MVVLRNATAFELPRSACRWTWAPAGVPGAPPLLGAVQPHRFVSSAGAHHSTPCKSGCVIHDVPLRPGHGYLFRTTHHAWCCPGLHSCCDLQPGCPRPRCTAVSCARTTTAIARRRRRGEGRGAAAPERARGNAASLADVIDVHSSDARCRGTVHAALQRLWLPGQPDLLAFAARSCPGFVLFPGALSARAQLALAHATLSQHVEPPAATNHAARFGALAGLCAAAEQGCVLEATPPVEAADAQQTSAQGRARRACGNATRRSADPHSSGRCCADGMSAAQQQASACAADEGGSCMRACQGERGAAGGSALAARIGARVPSEAAEPPDSRNARWRWVCMQPHHRDKRGQPRSDVITARHLRRKLRWATLGPPYGALRTPA